MENNITKSSFSLPALLSLLIPGLGQLFKNHWWRAAAMAICFIFLLRADFTGGMQIMPIVLLCCHFALAVWSGYDAYNAKKDWK